MVAAEILVESIDFTDAAVDAAGSVIRGVKLSGRTSRNKRQGKTLRYADEAIQQSAEVFNGCPVTVRGGHDRAGRDYDSQNGQLRSGRVEGMGTDSACSRFDWHLNPADPLTPKILYDAANFPANIPLSQEVMQWKERLTEQNEILVTEITKDPLLVGVAAVYRGGLNTSLFESLEHDMEIKTKEELQAHWPELCEQLAECACQNAATELGSLKAKLEEAVTAREAALAQVKSIEDQLSKYREAEELSRRSEEVRVASKEICGEKYELSTELLEDLLALYEGERFKRTLTEIARLQGLIETPPIVEEQAEEPVSTSGVSYKSNGKPRSARRVGYHNRLQ